MGQGRAACRSAGILVQQQATAPSAVLRLFSAQLYVVRAICRKAHAGYADAASYRDRAYCGKAPAPARGSARSGTVQAVANEGCGQRSYLHSGSAMRWPPERVLRPAGMARGRPRYRDYGWPAPLGRTKKTLPPAPATRGKKTKSGMR